MSDTAATATKTTGRKATTAPATRKTAAKAAAKKAPAKKAAAAAAPPVEPQLVFVDPRTLVIGANARTAGRVKLGAAFVASIKARGVIQPITAYRGGLGLDTDPLIVLRGQRRTLGAIEAGRDLVPVVVVAPQDDADRIGDQVIENDHRDGLDDEDRVEAFAQMALLGLPAGEIAKRTGHERRRVDIAIAMAGSAKVKAVAEKHPALTFDDLMAYAEFEDDPKAVARLDAAAARGWGFDHEVQALRDSVDQRAAELRVEAELRAAGVTVVERPSRNPAGSGKLLQLAQLRDADGRSLSVDGHAGCPGHGAYLVEEWLYPGDDGYEAAAAAAGIEPAARPAAAGDEDDEVDEALAVYAPEITYVCTSWEEHGHQPANPRATRATVHSSSSTTAAAPKTAAEAEAADAAAAAQKAAETEERRRVIRGNKAWDSALVVRRKFLRELLQGKDAPAKAAVFLAGTAVRRDSEINDTQSTGMDLLRELLGLEPLGSRYGVEYSVYKKRAAELDTMIEKASDGRALLLALGVALALYEAGAMRNAWRHEKTTDWNGRERSTVRYLRYLASIGYDLAPIERVTCGEWIEGLADPAKRPAEEPAAVSSGGSTVVAETAGGAAVVVAHVAHVDISDE